MPLSSATVYFPLIGPQPSVNHVTVIAYPGDHTGAVVPVHRASDVERVLGCSRRDEPIDALRIAVTVQFDRPDFAGRSFELALALADKLARYGCTCRGRTLFATGELDPQGRILPVGDLQQKARLAAETLHTGDLFIYPASERESDMHPLQFAGVETLSAHALNDLAHLWECVPHSAVTRQGQPAFEFLKGAGMGFVTVLAAATASSAAAWLFDLF